jgi:hypothetical protein
MTKITELTIKKLKPRTRLTDKRRCPKCGRGDGTRMKWLRGRSSASGTRLTYRAESAIRFRDPETLIPERLSW